MEPLETKIGMNTYFAYIYLNTDPSGGIELYTYDNDPGKLLFVLVRYYILVLAQLLGVELDETCGETDDIMNIVNCIEESGHGDALESLEELLASLPNMDGEETLRLFDKRFRLMVEDTDGAMDYSLCMNLVEFLQFLHQYLPETTVDEMLGDLLGGVELDCAPVA